MRFTPPSSKREIIDWVVPLHAWARIGCSSDTAAVLVLGVFTPVMIIGNLSANGAGDVVGIEVAARIHLVVIHRFTADSARLDSHYLSLGGGGRCGPGLLLSWAVALVVTEESADAALPGVRGDITRSSVVTFSPAHRTCPGTAGAHTAAPLIECRQPSGVKIHCRRSGVGCRMIIPGLRGRRPSRRLPAH